MSSTDDKMTIYLLANGTLRIVEGKWQHRTSTHASFDAWAALYAQLAGTVEWWDFAEAAAAVRAHLDVLRVRKTRPAPPQCPR
ncbi:hypothetical protein [Chenggangzhangella methanolivorans]|uniref:Uncharacterized protein n=2 Tax=Chenggangzhangella methanolivorans TaxID=1437009 RepID=A0A9E6UPE0_9HYPH|nr:hypothetical protein [Chenggangzhangella methanolivorans]QZN99644.1 hypothetical protein K6K41_23590 [Chenggangzhangella methanolivorans]